MSNEFVEFDAQFPAGTYYIGDFCYILKEKDYDNDCLFILNKLLDISGLEEVI